MVLFQVKENPLGTKKTDDKILGNPGDTSAGANNNQSAGWKTPHYHAGEDFRVVSKATNEIPKKHCPNKISSAGQEGEEGEIP